MILNQRQAENINDVIQFLIGQLIAENSQWNFKTCPCLFLLGSIAKVTYFTKHHKRSYYFVDAFAWANSSCQGRINCPTSSCITFYLTSSQKECYITNYQEE
jgi:hypothetical protein